MCLDTTNSYKKFLKEEWREDQQEEGKEYSCFSALYACKLNASGCSIPDSWSALSAMSGKMKVNL